jgi:electron transport complex protein RnfE
MSTEDTYSAITLRGLWENNVGLVQLLGLCPLLAVSSTVVNALGLGLATTAVLVASNSSVSLIRNLVRPEIRIPAFMIIIASFVTTIDLIMGAWFYDLHKILGIFIPLIVTNCSILGRAEAYASRVRIDRAALDGLMMGIGFTLVLVVLGGMREAIGQGTLFSHANLMFGEAARGWTITLIENYRGWLVAILPPGAFIGLGLLIAIKHVIDKRLQQASESGVPGKIEAAPATH